MQASTTSFSTTFSSLVFVGAGVVQKLADDGVQLRNVGGHVGAGVRVGHTHLGLQPQPGQRGAQVMRNAGQHHRAVLLDLGQALGHAVKADVDLADLTGLHAFVQAAGLKIALAHAAGGK